MRLCVFEDRGVDFLDPITLTRPAFDLWCGAATLLERHRRRTGATETGVLVRPHLAELCRLQHADLAVNDADWARREPTVFVNARWLPGSIGLGETDTPRVGLVGQQVVYLVGTSGPESYPAKLDEWLEHAKKTLPQVQAGGNLLDYLWDIVDLNPATLCSDLEWFRRERADTRKQPELGVVGAADTVAIAEGATIEPFVVADTRQGPVLIERGAVVHSFTRLEGPCYVGRDSWILGAKLRGGTIGPMCRIGGEIEASVVQGCSNKYHDGFLGHSYVGSWVNLAAGTQTSDLRNDYGMIRVYVAGSRVGSGRNKVGSFIGDHTKTGLNTLLNTGTNIGAFCNVISSGALSPQNIPSFCQHLDGELQERWDLRQLFQTASIAMRRRGCEFSEAHRDFFYVLYDQTADHRHKALRDSEHRRLRRSV